MQTRERERHERRKTARDTDSAHAWRERWGEKERGGENTHNPCRILVTHLSLGLGLISNYQRDGPEGTNTYVDSFTRQACV